MPNKNKKGGANSNDGNSVGSGNNNARNSVPNLSFGLHAGANATKEDRKSMIEGFEENKNKGAGNNNILEMCQIS